jgi:hypothetical protein
MKNKRTRNVHFNDATADSSAELSSVYGMMKNCATLIDIKIIMKKKSYDE